MFPSLTGITLVAIALGLLVTAWTVSIVRTNWFSGYTDRMWRFTYMLSVGSAVIIDLVLSVIVYSDYEVPSVVKHISGVLLSVGVLAFLRIKGSFLPMRPRHQPNTERDA